MSSLNANRANGAYSGDGRGWKIEKPQRRVDWHNRRDGTRYHYRTYKPLPINVVTGGHGSTWCSEKTINGVLCYVEARRRSETMGESNN